MLTYLSRTTLAASTALAVIAGAAAANPYAEYEGTTLVVKTSLRTRTTMR